MTLIEYIYKTFKAWLEDPQWVQSRDKLARPAHFMWMVREIAAKPPIPDVKTLKQWGDLLGLLAEYVIDRIGMDVMRGDLQGRFYHYDLSNKKFPVVLVGDLHGDVDTLIKIIEDENVLSGDRPVIFMGDYIDRGVHDLFVLIIVLMLKVYWGDNVIILKGNHEDWKISEDKGIYSPIKFDYPGQSFWLYYWKEKEYFSEELLDRVFALFDCLPVGVWVNDTLIVHGGIPRPVRMKEDNIPDYSGINITDPEVIVQMLWSDPEEKEFVYMLPDTRFSFGKIQFEAFAKEVNIKSIIRAHENVNSGYKLNFGKRVITLFSTGGKNSYYRNVDPAYGVLEDPNTLRIKRPGPKTELILDLENHSIKEGGKDE